MLLFVALSCEKIIDTSKVLNSTTADADLIHTCESCHSNKTILTILSHARGEAGGGG